MHRDISVTGLIILVQVSLTHFRTSGARRPRGRPPVQPKMQKTKV
jgi:hypothetical protein